MKVPLKNNCQIKGLALCLGTVLCLGMGTKPGRAPQAAGMEGPKAPPPAAAAQVEVMDSIEGIKKRPG